MKRQIQLLISCTLLLAPVSAAQAQSFEQDSLLPPEVVPLDPNAANSLSVSQAQNRQSNFANGSDAAAPGLVGNGGAQMSAQDMRKQAFEALYAQGQNQMPQEMPWRAGQQPANMSMAAQPMQQNQPYPMADNQTQQGYVAQSQTLTGGPKNQPQQKNTRRAGLSNVVNYATAFGAGAIMSGFLVRPTSPLLGAGMYGMTMTGLGVRNNSRF